MNKPENLERSIKDDVSKESFDLIPSYPLKSIARVLEFGAFKYGRNNWRYGMVWSRMYASALRHLTAWNDGEDKDPESGLSHLAHACCCLLFLIQYEKDCPGLDDRFTEKE